MSSRIGGNFFTAHYDWIVAGVAVVAFACAVVFFTGALEEDADAQTAAAVRRIESRKPDGSGVKPADMEEGRFEELRKMIDPVMCHVMLSPAASTLVMQLSIPALTRQERDDIQPIIKQISFKWDGQTFKEY